jgi:glycerate 2-kinase
VPDTSTPRAALEVLERFDADEAGVAPKVFEYLESRKVQESLVSKDRELLAPGCWDNFVIGNNATAVAAAAAEATRLGYSVAATSAARSEGLAEDVGRDLAETALRIRNDRGPQCLISGGEPVVKLVEASRRGLGGRNEQLVLAALMRLADDGAEGVALLSGGTDGEDGPTDAAGAFLDAEVLAAARRENLDAADYLARNDAYRFFAALGALIKTGPTQTNVCDLRVAVASGVREAEKSADP